MGSNEHEQPVPGAVNLTPDYVDRESRGGPVI